MGEDRNLGIDCAVQFRLFALKAELCHVKPSHLGRAVKHAPRRFTRLIQFLAHAGVLRALTGEKRKSIFHKIMLLCIT